MIDLEILKIIMLKLVRLTHKLARGGVRWCISWNKDPFASIQQSEHYQPRVSVEQFLRENSIEFSTASKTFRIKECFFCSKPHYNDITNMFTLNVKKDQGLYYCHRCQSKGRWMDFRARYLGIQNSSQASVLMSEDYYNNSTPSGPPTEISEVEYYLHERQLRTPEFEQVLLYLKSRGFTDATLTRYRVGAGIERFTDHDGATLSVKVIYFPMCVPKKNKNSLEPPEWSIMKLKIRGGSSTTKKFMRQAPPGKQSGFFGLHTVSRDDKTVVLTQGQFDAMSVYQKTGYPAISLPQGANSLPDHLLPYLDQFETIILWVDKDEAGRLAEEKIGFKLGDKRTRIVKHQQLGLKDANDFLKSKPQMMKPLLEASKTKSEENILKFSDMLADIKKRITHSQEYVGTSVDWLKFFNKKVKGVRMEELSIVSGQTGSGKTTFLSQMSLDLAKKGVPVLWGSFQVRNEVLISNMLLQFSQVNLLKKSNVHMFDTYAEKFSQLPMSWLSFHGSHDYLKVLSTIQYAIEKSNISFVILDTLQFFLSGQAEGSKKFDLQDEVMGRLRKIATNYKVHIVVVIHPRKTDDQEDIQVHSIYGSSKSSQEADNIWMIQKRQNYKIFDVKKNRFDGDVGRVAIGFDKQIKTYFQLKKSQLEQLRDQKKTFEEILEERRGKESKEDEYQFSMEDSAKEKEQGLHSRKNTNNKRY